MRKLSPEMIASLTEKPWDAVIVGAGVAGGVSAALLAQRQWRVLLLEKSAWPREKVCGGCVNAAAVAMLHQVGLGAVLRGANRLRHYTLHVQKRRLQLDILPGVSMSRRELDERIVTEAVSRGCMFVPGAAATLKSANPGEDFRQLTIGIASSRLNVRARMVLACDGIGGTLLDHEPWANWRVARTAWIGVATTLHEMADWVDTQTIAMHVGIGGYVGLAWQANGQLHVGAALSPTACRAAGGPAPLITQILQQCGVPVPQTLARARFAGTGLLTRRRAAVGGFRVLAVGDACGYVEPFTGEGIAWAIRGATEVVKILPDPALPWTVAVPRAWARQYEIAIGLRQRWCRTLMKLARRPRLAAALVALTQVVPAAARGLARRIGRQSWPEFQAAQGAAK